MGWIACVHFQKFRCEFVARTFALIAPVQPSSHRVSCSNEIIQNAPKHYKTHQFMSWASNGVDQVRSLWKILTQIRGTNFCTRSAHFPPSFVRQPNGPECTQWYETHQNICLRTNGMNRGCSLRIIPPRLLGTNYCIICTSSACFPPSFTQ